MMAMGAVIERFMAQRDEALKERDAALGRVTELEKREAFQDRCWTEVHEALKCPGDKNLAEWAKGRTAKFEELERQAAQRDLDDAVSAAALEMLDRLGLDPNGTELAEIEESKEGGA